MNFPAPDKSRHTIAFDLTPGEKSVVILSEGNPRVNGKLTATIGFLPSYASLIGNLEFQTPKQYNPANPGSDFPVLRSKDVLQGIIERGEFQ